MVKKLGIRRHLFCKLSIKDFVHRIIALVFKTFNHTLFSNCVVLIPIILQEDQTVTNSPEVLKYFLFSKILFRTRFHLDNLSQTSIVILIDYVQVMGYSTKFILLIGVDFSRPYDIRRSFFLTQLLSFICSFQCLSKLGWGCELEDF